MSKVQEKSVKRREVLIKRWKNLKLRREKRTRKTKIKKVKVKKNIDQKIKKVRRRKRSIEKKIWRKKLNKMMRILVWLVREILESPVIGLRVLLLIRRKTKRKKTKKKDDIVHLMGREKRRKKTRKRKEKEKKIAIRVNTNQKTRKKKARKIKNTRVKSVEDLHLMMIQMMKEVINGLLGIVNLIMGKQDYCLTFQKIGEIICLKNFMILIILIVH